MDHNAKRTGSKRLNHERHNIATEAIFYSPYTEVHTWLDETYSEVKHGKAPYTHWLARHHKEAIDKEYEAPRIRAVAYFHVVSDIAGRFEEIFLPENEEELRRFLKKLGIKLV